MKTNDNKLTNAETPHSSKRRLDAWVIPAKGDEMETVNIQKFKCSICGELYDNPEEARSCEDKPVSQDKGVKIGDTVLITGGDGTGKNAIVEKIWIIDKCWGHYAWKRYWHTVCLGAEIIDGFGNRVLTFDNYEPV